MGLRSNEMWREPEDRVAWREPEDRVVWRKRVSLVAPTD